MSSPDVFPLFQSLQLKREGGQNLYLQIADFIDKLIEKGTLQVGQKLPGTRNLANYLGVHRKTVIAAYDELQEQGRIETKEQVGTFVLPLRSKWREHSLEVKSNALQISANGFTFKRSSLLDSPYESHLCTYSINDGQPDYRLTQMDELARLYRNSMKRKLINRKLGDQQVEGTDYFKSQLAHYVRVSRGLIFQKEELLLAKSTEMLLFMLAQILVEKEDVVLVGNPSYFSANMIFQQAGARLKTISVDKEGLVVEEIAQQYKKGEIRMVYLHPRSDYPTTVPLSKERRALLLRLAEEMDFIVVEDDSDYEFNYDRPVLPSLLSEDTMGKVIYLGTVGHSLSPTFKTGFLISNTKMVEEGEKLLALLDRQKDVIMEQTLGELIESGEMVRQWKKSIKVYRDRRNKLMILLNEHLSDWVDFEIPKNGLAIWLKFKKSISLTQLARYCQDKSVFIPRNCLYQNKSLTAIRLGFGHLDIREMESVVVCLHDAVLEQM